MAKLTIESIKSSEPVSFGRLGPFFDAIKESVIVTDASGVITEWNSTAEELYGWSAEEVIGRNIVEVTPAPAMAHVAEQIMETLLSGKTWAGEFSVQHRDGHQFDVWVMDAPIIEDGVLQGVIGFSMRVNDAAPEETAGRELLTPREVEVARLTASAKTSAEIAATLGIGVRTVETHRSNAYRKLAIRNRSELIAISLRDGLRSSTDIAPSRRSR